MLKVRGSWTFSSFFFYFPLYSEILYSSRCHWQMPCGLHSVIHNVECLSFASCFHLSDINESLLGVGPCSAVFLFLAVHGQTCSVIGFKFLHHDWLKLGVLQPCQIRKDFHQRGIVYLPYRRLRVILPMRPWHLHSIMRQWRKGVQIRITALTNP